MGKKFISSWLERHFGERSFKIDLLNFGKQVSVCTFFLLGDEKVFWILPVAEEATGIMKKRLDLRCVESAGIVNDSTHQLTRKAQTPARCGIFELLGEEGERANGEAFERVFYVGTGICRFEVLDRLEATAREDIAEIGSRRWNELAGGCPDERVVLARWETVQESKIVELATAPSFLDKFMVEVIHLSCVGTKKDAVGNEMGGNFGDMDAIEEALQLCKFLRR